MLVGTYGDVFMYLQMFYLFPLVVQSQYAPALKDASGIIKIYSVLVEI